MNAQAGLVVDRQGLDCTITPKNIFRSGPLFDDFELAVQIPTEAKWTLFFDGKEVECKCVDSPAAPNVTYVDSVVPIRIPVRVGEHVHIKLVAEWKSRRGVESKQTIMDGTFETPETMQTMGAPGYTVYVPHLKTLAHIAVGNIIQKETGEIRLEFLQFNVTLMT